MNTATPIKPVPFRGDAALYRLDPPMEGRGGAANEYVVVSAVDEQVYSIRVRETYIFAADKDGKVTDWIELPGSLKDTTSHTEALAAAGYTL
jgi:hypothetical protein